MQSFDYHFYSIPHLLLEVTSRYGKTVPHRFHIHVHVKTNLNPPPLPRNKFSIYLCLSFTKWLKIIPQFVEVLLKTLCYF